MQTNLTPFPRHKQGTRGSSIATISPSRSTDPSRICATAAPLTVLRGRILQIPGEQRHAWSVFDGECAVARNVLELGQADAHRSLDAALAAEYLRVETITEPDDHDLLQDAHSGEASEKVLTALILPSPSPSAVPPSTSSFARRQLYARRPTLSAHVRQRFWLTAGECVGPLEVPIPGMSARWR